MLPARLLFPLAAALLAACAPDLDWREVRPEDSAAQVLMPCRARTQTRELELDGRRVRWSLAACTAGGETWGLAFADLGDPAGVTGALQAMRVSAAGNVGATGGTPLALNVPGSTPNPASARVALQGRLPDGSAVEEQVAVFTRGTRVYQASVVGERLPAEETETFFASIRLGS